MDTTSGNRSIAELLGYDFSFDKEKEYYLINKSGELLYATFHKESYDREVEKEFNYHSDWNQIMPVVEYIQSNHALEFAIEFGTESNFDGIVEKFYRAGFYREDKPFCRHPEWQKSQILAVWFTVVRFIQWYNEKK